MAQRKAGKESCMKHIRMMYRPSMSMDVLEDVYQMHRGKKRPNGIPASIGDISLLPDSYGMAFGPWFDLCKQTVDVYEVSL